MGKGKGSSGKREADRAVLSMTGFGSSSGQAGSVHLELEVKTVNSRYLDCVFRIPRIYNAIEHELRDKVKEFIKRGRVEVHITRKVTEASQNSLQFDEHMFSELMNVYENGLKSRFSDGHSVGEQVVAQFVSDVMSKREVLELGQTDEVVPEEKETAFKLFEEALKGAIELRKVEGKKLLDDLSERLEKLKSIRLEIGSKVEKISETLRDRLRTRVGSLLGDVSLDEGRLEQEVAYLADKADVTEELVRLESHFKEFQRISSEGPSGKKLDFLVQEFMREFNTINSKSQNAEVQKLVVEAKSQVEKIREQLQNVE